MTRAAIYARVSSEAQRERHSIESQLRELPAYVKAQDWELIETYVDDGRSARTGKLEAREGFARLVRDADQRRFDVVVVVDVDRLTRTQDLEERARILGPFQRNGIQIVTPSGGTFDLRTMLGELYVTFQGLIAAEENRKRSERIRQGRITAATRGRLPSGRAPYGLAYDKASGAWSIHPMRGPLVVEMFERVARGESCRAIACDLDERGVPREGGRWHRGRVAAIVRAQYPVGRWVADTKRNLAIVVPRIVSDDLWRRAQDELDKVGNRFRGLRHTRHEYLLEGIGVCGACGSLMGIRTPNAYICNARRVIRSGSPGRCEAPIVPAREADERAWAAIRRELEDPDLDAAIVGAVKEREADRHDWEADAAGYRRKLERLQDSESKLLARFTRGAVSEGALDQELARIGRERAALHAQLETATRATAAASVTAAQLRDASAILAQLRERLADAPFPVRRALVQRLIRPGDVVFRGADLRIMLRVPRPPVAATSGASVDASCPISGQRPKSGQTPDSVECDLATLVVARCLLSVRA